MASLYSLTLKNISFPQKPIFINHTQGSEWDKNNVLIILREAERQRLYTSTILPVSTPIKVCLTKVAEGNEAVIVLVNASQGLLPLLHCGQVLLLVIQAYPLLYL